jgi:hypothetical protein
MEATFGGSDTGLKDAVAYVASLDSDQRFWDLIRSKTDYDYATVDGAEIASRLQAPNPPITIRLWKPSPLRAWGYRNTVAVTDSRNHPHVLFYHTKFLGNDTGSKVNTIVHEYVHNVDLLDDGDVDEQMGHGDNNWRGKGDSPPYWIGRQAESLYNEATGRVPLVEPAEAIYTHVETVVEDSEIVTDA